MSQESNEEVAKAPNINPKLCEIYPDMADSRQNPYVYPNIQFNFKAQQYRINSEIVGYHVLTYVRVKIGEKYMLVKYTDSGAMNAKDVQQIPLKRVARKAHQILFSSLPPETKEDGLVVEDKNQETEQQRVNNLVKTYKI